MAARNTTRNTNANETIEVPVYISVNAALARLGDIKRSTFAVAVKRHSYLKDAMVTEIHPETGTKWTKILVSAVDQYAAERRQGGQGSSHGGAKKLTVWLTDEEREIAEQLLTEKFGRDISIDRLYKGKVKADADETDADADETDDDADADETDDLDA